MGALSGLPIRGGSLHIVVVTGYTLSRRNKFFFPYLSETNLTIERFN